MKNKFYFLLLFVATLVAKITGQITYPPPCAPYTDEYGVSHPTQSTACNDIRNAFIPKTFDRQLTISLAFYIYNEQNGTGRWSTTTETHIDSVVSKLNQKFGNLVSPHNIIPGVPFISDAKIRFVKKAYNKLNYSFGYHNYVNGFSAQFANDVNDCNAINIIYSMSVPANGVTNGNTPIAPGKFVFMPADTDVDEDGNLRVPDHERYIGDLAHELGHALGLKHTNNFEGFSLASINMGAPSCCDYIIADDVVLQVYHPPGLPGDPYIAMGECNWTGSPTFTASYSNNFMGYNSSCRQYFSPYQIAIMHYHLRTNMKDVLTTSGYTNAITVDHNFDYYVGTAETWNSDRYMKGNVIIPAGHSLTITCNVAMTRSASIVVEPTAKLVIDGGRISNISGELWAGIQVAGDASQNQNYTVGGFADYQGLLVINNHGTISNAENGARNYKVDVNDRVLWNSRGGIILADNADFINNTRDVEFISYTTAPSVSSFVSCNFITNGAIGKTSTGTYAQPLAHVSIWDMTGVKFRSCNFEYAAGALYSDHGVGIGTYNAKYTVDKIGVAPATFQNLQTGVYADNGNPLRLPVITYGSFYDNVIDAVYFQNLNSVVFNNNYIRPPNNSNGLYLNSCQQYNIKNNTFEQNAWPNKTSKGVSAFNSTTGAHQVYRNIFNNLQMGIRVIGNNSGDSNIVDGLKMNCNDFSAIANYYDIGLLPGNYPNHTTVMTEQGKINVGSTKLVRNIYGASSTCSGCENQWYVSGSGAKQVSHPANSQANTRPVPQPDLSDLSVTVINSGIPLVYSTHCLSNQESSGGDGTLTPIELMSSITNYLEKLKGDNEGDVNHFEIEATAVSKLYLFLTDSVLQNKDSVISLLEANPGNMDNADILTVYAYMDKGDLVTAQQKVDSLPGSRAAWAAALSKLIAYEAEPWKLYDLKENEDDILFWKTYTVNENQDGFALAQAVLKTFGGKTFSDPRPEPGEESGARFMQSQTAQTGEAILTTQEARISVYPNPASDLVSIAYNNAAGKTLRLELKDALGRKVYESPIKGGDRLDVPITGFSNGVYILTAYDHRTAVYQSKVVCIK